MQTPYLLAIGLVLGIVYLVLQPLSAGQGPSVETPSEPAGLSPESSPGTVFHKTTFSTPRSDPLAKALVKGDRGARLHPNVDTPRVITVARPRQRGSSSKRMVDLSVRGGTVLLNSFGTRSMPLDDLACAEMAEDIVWHHSLPNEAVHLLANDDLMHQVRICGTNGHVLITCYQNTATVSLRQPAPRDGCQG